MLLHAKPPIIAAAANETWVWFRNQLVSAICLYTIILHNETGAVAAAASHDNEKEVVSGYGMLYIGIHNMVYNVVVGMAARRGCACKLTLTHDIMYIYVHYIMYIYIYTRACP